MIIDNIARNNNNRYNERYSYFFYVLLSFIVVISIGELNKPIFTLDFPIGPNIYYKELFPTVYGFEAPVWGGFVVWKLFYLLTPILTAPIMQKFLLFLILFVAGTSAHQAMPLNSNIARLFAGTLYMLNPYTYIRILVGHFLILFAFAILPLALKSFIELLEKGGRKEIVKFVFLMTLVGINSHTLIISIIAEVVILIFWFWQNRNAKTVNRIVIAGIFFILLNSFWLIPFLTAGDTLVTSIGSEDLASFAPRIESFSALFTLASMHGFWRAGYEYAGDFIPFWQALFVFILFLAVTGFLSYYRDEKIGMYVKAFGAISILGLLLAAGIHSPFSEIFRWLFDHTLLKGMRDSHKFVTLLVLAYAYLGALSVSEIEKTARNASNKYMKLAALVVVIMALAVPLVYSFAFFNGFAGQLKAADYPDDWYEVNELLSKDERDFNVLFFPWHQYMNFHWVPNKDKRIGNPAQNFFDKEIITGKNVEIGEIYRQMYSPEQLYIDFLIKEKDNIKNFGELIAPLNIKYILLTKEVDYKKYFFLFNQSDLELDRETENFYVFKNRHEVAKFYEVDSMVYIRDWGELLERSNNEDITGRIYLIGDLSGDEQVNSSKGLPGYEKKSPVKYELDEAPSRKYLVFTEPYAESWELGRKKPIPAYGIVNAYKVNGTNNREIRYERFYNVYIPSYIISLLSLFGLIAFYSGLHKEISHPIRRNS